MRENGDTTDEGHRETTETGVADRHTPPDGDQQQRSVALPAETVADIEARLSRTQFDSVDAYAAAALECLLRELDRQEDGEPEATTDPETVRQRLESLGYL
jgi:Arc/MetJ-type ribon-helix-helix transcriptional regulator